MARHVDSVWGWLEPYVLGPIVLFVLWVLPAGIAVGVMLLLSGCVSVQERALPGGVTQQEYESWPIESVSYRHGYNTDGWTIVYLNRIPPENPR